MGVLLTGPSIKGSSQVGSKKKPVRRHRPELHTTVCKGGAWQHSTQEKYCIPCHLILLACSEWTIGRKNDTTGRARGLGRKTREGDRNGEPNDNPETPDRGATRHPRPPSRVNTNHNLFEEKGEPKRYRTEVLPLTSLMPYHLAIPAHEWPVLHAPPYKLLALVYHILPPTTAITDYAISLGKLSANGRFFVGVQMAVTV